MKPPKKNSGLSFLLLTQVFANPPNAPDFSFGEDNKNIRPFDS